MGFDMTNDIKSRICTGREDYAYRANKRVLFGVVLICIGSIFLLERLGYIPSHLAGHYWPIVLCAFGLNRLLFSQYTYRKIKGFIEIFLAFWIFACLEHLWGWTFSLTWPMILIALGLCYIGSYLFKNNNVDNGKPL